MRSFKSNEDIYIFANELINRAKINGDFKIIDVLERAINRGGFSPSERLGELRIAFKEIQKIIKDEDKICPLDDIRAAINAIDKAFNEANRPW